MVVVVDDENRENEGDLICAAQFATPEQINFMATEARGLICLAMEGERLDELDLPLMVDRNTDSNQTAFTVSVDAGPENGVSTGISAEDRASPAALLPLIEKADPFGGELHRQRQDPVLLAMNALRQARLTVPWQHRHRRLNEHRSCVHLQLHEVGRAAGQLDARLQGLADGLGPSKAG